MVTYFRNGLIQLHKNFEIAYSVVTQIENVVTGVFQAQHVKIQYQHFEKNELNILLTCLQG